MRPEKRPASAFPSASQGRAVPRAPAHKRARVRTSDSENVKQTGLVPDQERREKHGVDQASDCYVFLAGPADLAIKEPSQSHSQSSHEQCGSMYTSQHGLVMESTRVEQMGELGERLARAEQADLKRRHAVRHGNAQSLASMDEEDEYWTSIHMPDFSTYRHRVSDDLECLERTWVYSAPPLPDFDEIEGDRTSHHQVSRERGHIRVSWKANVNL